MPAATASPTGQAVLSLGPLRNSEFLSNHWLENRLPIEPEWRELRQRAQDTASRLIDIWNAQANRVERYGDEAGLEHAFIQPVFEALGWKIKYQAFLDGREPDYALFLTDDDLDFAIQAGRHSPEFWRHAASVGDAKAWHISLDRPSRTSGRREYPPEQIEWYLDRSRADYGFLTNGRYWRLVPRVLADGKPRFQTFFEVDLPYLLRLITPTSNKLGLGPGGPDFDQHFMPFYMLFSADGFRQPVGRIPLIQRAATAVPNSRLAWERGCARRSSKRSNCASKASCLCHPTASTRQRAWPSAGSTASSSSTACYSSCTARTAACCHTGSTPPTRPTGRWRGTGMRWPQAGSGFAEAGQDRLQPRGDRHLAGPDLAVRPD